MSLKNTLIDAEFDIKELLKEEQKKIDADEKYNPDNKSTKASAQLLIANSINIESLFGISTKYQLQRSLHPQIQYTKNYIVLDSKNRVPSNDLRQITWNYIADAIYQQGTVNTKGIVRDLIGLRFYPIRIAQNFGLSGVYNPNFTLLIEEFKSQSFIGARNYHVALRQTPNPTVPPAPSTIAQQELTPLNDGYYWFYKPFVTINTISISLANPVVPINVPIAQQILYTQYFTYGLITTITAPFALGYTNGDLVIISNFTTADPITDAAVIADMNDVNGHVITVINAYTFTITVDTSTITPLPDSSRRPFYLTNENLRVIIPIELIYIAPDSNEIDA